MITSRCACGRERPATPQRLEDRSFRGDKEPQGDTISFTSKCPLFTSKTRVVYDVISDLGTDRILTALSVPSIRCNVNVTQTRAKMFGDGVHV